MRVIKRQKGSQSMIRWRLRVLMAEKNISNKELSERSGIHRTSISKLKNIDEIEQISGRVLNNLCHGLTLAYHARGDNQIITPNDLFDYTYDGDNYHPIPTDTSSIDHKSSSSKPSSTDSSSPINFQVIEPI